MNTHQMSGIVARLFADFVEALPNSVELSFVDYDDRLTDEQASAVLAQDWESLSESIVEWDMDTRYESERSYIDGTLNAVLSQWEHIHARIGDDIDTEAIRDAFMDEYEDAAREQLWDRDESDPIRTLAEHTGRTFARIAIGDAGEVAISGDESPEELAELFDLPRDSATLAALSEVAPELYSGGTYRAFLFASIDVGDVYGLPWECESVAVRGGALLIEDTWNGAGMDALLPADHVTIVARSAMRSDADQVGYSWDEVCGLVARPYAAEITDAARATVATVAA